MVWSLQFQLLEGEKLVESSLERPQSGVKTAYSVFLTDKRVVFRFDGFGSHLAQSFNYPEILDIKQCKRLFVNYLLIKTAQKDYFLNIPETEYWAGQILQMKQQHKPEVKNTLADKKQELLDMLKDLRAYSILSQAELEEKINLIENLSE